MKKLTSGHILAEGMKQIGRAAFTTPSVSRRNSTTDTESKKSMSPFSRRMSRDDRFGSKNSVTSSASFGVSHNNFITLFLGIHKFIFFLY